MIPKFYSLVAPAKAGVQEPADTNFVALGARFRGHDGKGGGYQASNSYH